VNWAWATGAPSASAAAAAARRTERDMRADGGTTRARPASRRATRYLALTFGVGGRCGQLRQTACPARAIIAWASLSTR
jgi:ribosomal protein L44E